MIFRFSLAVGFLVICPKIKMATYFMAAPNRSTLESCLCHGKLLAVLLQSRPHLIMHSTAQLSTGAGLVQNCANFSAVGADRDWITFITQMTDRLFSQVSVRLVGPLLSSITVFSPTQRQDTTEFKPTRF